VQLSLTSLFGKATVNAVRVGLSRRTAGTSTPETGPGIKVLDAFNGGANQDFFQTDSRKDALQVSDHLTFVRKTASFKIGIDVDGIQRKDLDRSNFTGTFVFGSDVERDALGVPILGDRGTSTPVTPLEDYRRTLLGLPGYGPSQFSVVRGDPRINYTQSWVGWFAQHDWTIHPRLSLLYGVRHEFQTLIESHTNFAPRAGLGWALDGARKNIVRLSAGLFFQRLGDDLMSDLIRFDGLRRRLVVIERPSFFPEVSDQNEVPITAAVHTLAEHLKSPEWFTSTVGYERRLPGAVVGISATREVGWRLLRVRNVNAPIGGPSGARPFPERGPILGYEGTGSSLRRELLVTLQTAGIKAVSVTGHYALSSFRTDTDGASTLPANPYDLSTEYGPSQTDRRHQGSVGVSFTVPWVGVDVTSFVTAASAQPFNITTGRDDNGDSLFTDRPAFGELGAPGVVTTPYGVFNPTPAPGDRIIPRNFGREASQVRLDLRVGKTFGVGAGVKLELTADAQNLLNRANLSDFNGVLTSPVFGRPNRAVNPRRVSLGTRLSF